MRSGVLLYVFVHAYVSFSVLWAQLPELNDMMMMIIMIISLLRRTDNRVEALSTELSTVFYCVIFYLTNSAVHPYRIYEIQINL